MLLRLFARISDKKFHDKTFEYLLESEFWKDLELIIELSSIPSYNQDQVDKKF